MSLVLEGIKMAWDHKGQIFDAVVMGGGALVGGRLLYGAFTSEVPPARAQVGIRRLGGRTSVLLDMNDQVRTGLTFRDPLERRKLIYTGVISVDLQDQDADGIIQDITMKYPDGSESMKWRFKCTYDWSVIPGQADVLLRHFESRESEPGFKSIDQGPDNGILAAVGIVIKRYAAEARVETLTSKCTDDVFKVGGLEGFRAEATARLRNAVSLEEWGKAIRIHTVRFPDYTEPEEFRARNEAMQEIAVTTARRKAEIGIEAMRLKVLGQRYATNLAFAQSGGRLNLFVEQGGNATEGDGFGEIEKSYDWRYSQFGDALRSKNPAVVQRRFIALAQSFAGEPDKDITDSSSE